MNISVVEGEKNNRMDLLWTWTLAVLILIYTLNFLRFRFNCFFGNQKPIPVINCTTESTSKQGISGIISDLDLKNLIDNLDERFPNNAIWENIVDKRNNRLSYQAKCCNQRDGPLTYLSVTTFQNCSAELLKKYYMDMDYRKLWDKTVVDHEQLQVDQASGTEIGRTIKKFPFLTPREYVLAWRLWQAKDGSLYCFSKECEHPLVPKQKKYVRVTLFRSGWRIRKVAGRNACEIKMMHQEDAGLNVEMAKLAFTKGIWNYVCKMDDALRKYSTTNLKSTVGPNTSIQKVPPEYEIKRSSSSIVDPEEKSAGNSSSICSSQLRVPSHELIRNGLIFVGGAICLCRGHSSLGVKVAMAYVLTRLTKHVSSSNNRSTQGSVS